MPRANPAVGRATARTLLLVVSLVIMVALLGGATWSFDPSSPERSQGDASDSKGAGSTCTEALSVGDGQGVGLLALLPSCRDPYVWPFSPESIWNLPIGAGAIFVSAQIKAASSYGMTTDADVIILKPNAPITPVYYNDDAWSRRSRCKPEGPVLFEAPIPADFIVPGARGTDTPNFATAILMPDRHTLAQGQPMARCTAGEPATMWWFQQDEDLYGTGRSGAHGGSMLSSIGGTIRLGELVPAGVIRHALKVDLYGKDNYFYDSVTQGYRWPATTADAAAPSSYGGSLPALRMGSLLALSPSLDIANLGLETEPARILAHAFQDYGAYVVDDAGWSVYAIETEFSPDGRVEDEFQSAWGFTMTPSSQDVPWSRDMDRIFLNLAVVDNWDEATWQRVSASSGAEGAGGGAPRASWAPDLFCSPKTLISVSGTAGQDGWYRSAASVTLSARGGSGIVTIHFRTDGGAWQTYTNPFTVQGDSGHTIEFYATDEAGSTEPTQTLSLRIDATPPSTSARVDGNRVTLTSSDATSGVQSIQYRVDGGAWQTYTRPFRITGSGAHAVDYFATDKAGNVESAKTIIVQNG